ncbi:hypothetical protein [Candidatus Villigracilis proximus]|uniref:hypothetical protein n=1 Tax=Candidatus Villigracilis proximus TaxID=3140683 RepID=UPI0031E5F46D
MVSSAFEQLPEIDRRASILRWGSYFSPRQRAVLWKPEFHFNADNAQSLLAKQFDSAEGSYLDKTFSTLICTLISPATYSSKQIA